VAVSGHLPALARPDERTESSRLMPPELLPINRPWEQI
jgi:hypothetical protein